SSAPHYCLALSTKINICALWRFFVANSPQLPFSYPRNMYEKFQELDGTHPWRSVSPDGYIDYRARYRPQGRVIYFNFPLATEMGLIPADHPHSINKELE